MFDFATYSQRLCELSSYFIKKIHGNEAAPVVCHDPKDRRFQDKRWNDIPIFDFLKQFFLLHQQTVTDFLEKNPPKNQDMTMLMMKNWLDSLSPSNFPWTNPIVLDEMMKTNGESLWKGCQKLYQDCQKDHFLSLASFVNLESFEVGKNLAVTKGKVVFKTDIFELICYEPTSSNTYSIPILVIPPWINKFYICDLQPHNSFVKFLIDQGFSVWIISWANGHDELKGKQIKDYSMSIYDSLLFVQNNCNRRVHAIGYCTGGVGLLLSKESRQLIETITLLAVPIDFDKMGDMRIFVTPKIIEDLKKMHETSGFFPGDLMANIFSILRSNDMIWSNFVDMYYLNKEKKFFDILYWNCDTADIPASLHLDYLENIFLKNALIPHVQDLSHPLFILSAENDHIVPPASAFSIKDLCSQANLVLAGGGHSAGVIHPPPGKYGYTINNRIGCHKTWWLELRDWLTHYDSSKSKHHYDLLPTLNTAPGEYVLRKTSHFFKAP